MMMESKIYDLLKKVQHLLPLVASLYLGLSKVWTLPYSDEVNQTIILICTFLGGIIEVMYTNYKKGKENDDK